MAHERPTRSEAKKAQILDAAEQLFLENGFAGTSMDAVTLTAGVSKQTVYSYFNGKDELFVEVLRNLIDQWTPEQITQPNQADVDSREDLEIALVHMCDRLTSLLMQPTYLAIIRMTISELQRFPRLGDLFKQAVPYRVMGSVENLLENARSKGTVTFDDAATASRLLVGPLVLHVLLHGLLVVDPVAKPSHPNNAQLVSLFIRAVS